MHGFAVTRLGKRHPSQPVVRTTTPYGDTVYWIGPVGLAADATPGTDFHAVEQGTVAAMRKRISQPDVSQAVPGRPSPVRYDSGRLSPGVTPANSNTRISAATLPRQPQAPVAAAGSNLGLNSDRLRQAMVQRLRSQGVTDERVLNAMSAVPRHLFVDEALASRAYEDAALPIGHSQTISQPWVVARMIAAVCEDRTPTRVLEVGAGCGYQAEIGRASWMGIV
ncbi:hypothetical protein G6F22_017205 [Rhizopus arrhizus]|nr:hypothetical protein G6F22_017205 [Rhizopus arrhizus]